MTLCRCLLQATETEKVNSPENLPGEMLEYKSTLDPHNDSYYSFSSQQNLEHHYEKLHCGAK